MSLLEGKKGLILNIANDRSIATHIANNAIKQGATCGFGFLPMENIEKSQRRVKMAMEENGFADAWLHPCEYLAHKPRDLLVKIFSRSGATAQRKAPLPLRRCAVA